MKKKVAKCRGKERAFPEGETRSATITLLTNNLSSCQLRNTTTHFHDFSLTHSIKQRLPHCFKKSCLAHFQISTCPFWFGSAIPIFFKDEIHRTSGEAFSYWKQVRKEGMWDLFFVKVHAVPVMGQGGHLSLPVLQEGYSPEGHEHTEEDRTWVVK